MNQHDSVETRGAATLPHVQQKAFRTALWVNIAGGRREKSVRCGLNLLQCLFGKLLIDKSLLIFLSLTLLLVFAACHSHPVSGQQSPVGVSLPAAGQVRGSQPHSPQPPTQEQAAGQCLPHPGHPTWIREMDEGSNVLVLLSRSLWLQLPESAECWLKGQPGDRDISLLGGSGV